MRSIANFTHYSLGFELLVWAHVCRGHFLTRHGMTVAYRGRGTATASKTFSPAARRDTRQYVELPFVKTSPFDFR